MKSGPVGVDNSRCRRVEGHDVEEYWNCEKKEKPARSPKLEHRGLLVAAARNTRGSCSSH